MMSQLVLPLLGQATPAPGVFEQLSAVVIAVWGLLIALLQALVPWTPLLLWIAFWLLAVNWRQLYPVLMQGGLVGVLLLGVIAILVWASVAEPEGGVHHVLGLRVSSFWGKAVYVTGLGAIAALCGSVQLSGGCPACCRFDDEVLVEADDAHAHASAHH